MGCRGDDPSNEVLAGDEAKLLLAGDIRPFAWDLLRAVGVEVAVEILGEGALRICSFLPSNDAIRFFTLLLLLEGILADIVDWC